MATKLYREITTVSPTAAGQTTTISLPLGRTYHGVIVEYREGGSLAARADLEAALRGVRVKMNGNVQWGNGNLIAADLNVVNEFDGRPITDGYLEFPFASNRARTLAGDEGNAIGTRNLTSFDIEIDVDAGATTPTIKVFALWDETKRDLIALRKINKRNVVSGGAEDVQVNTGWKWRDVMKRIHCRSSLVTAARVDIDGNEKLELNAARAAFLYSRRDPAFVPVSNNFHIAFDEDRRADSGWALQKDDGSGKLIPVDEFLVALTCSGAGTVPLVMETYGAPNN